MTTYTKNGFRYYNHPATGKMMPSVTSILSLLPSPELQRWKEQKIINSCLNELEQINNLDRALAIRYLSEAPKRESHRAINEGIEIHKKIENRNKKIEIKREDREFIRSYEALLEKHKITVQSSELRGFNTELGYAGTIDALASMGGKRILLDFKTGRKLYINAALQLVAYSCFDDFEGLEEPIEIDGLYVVHIRDGNFRLFKVQKEWSLRSYFYSLVELFDHY